MFRVHPYDDTHLLPMVSTTFSKQETPVFMFIITRTSFSFAFFTSLLPNALDLQLTRSKAERLIAHSSCFCNKLNLGRYPSGYLVSFRR